MAGTREGGVKARQTNLEKYGPDFYKTIGKRGGQMGVSGGFASDKVGADGLTGSERARIAGSKGGTKSKRKGTIFVERDGEKITLVELAKKLNLPYRTVLRRYHKGEL